MSRTPWASGLDPTIEHRLEILVMPEQPLKAGETLKLALHGVGVDEGTR